MLVPRETTVGGLKARILAQLRPAGAAPSEYRLRRNGPGGGEGPLLCVEEEDLSLDDACLYSGGLVTLEPAGPLRRASGDLVLRYTVGSSGSAEQWRLQTNSGATAAQLTAALCAHANARGVQSGAEPWSAEKARLRQAEGEAAGSEFKFI